MPTRSKALRAAESALRKVYDLLPRLECKGLCHRSCGPIPFTPLEQLRMERAHGGPLPVPTPDPQSIQELACPLLEQQRCSIYPDRPLICRLWGVVKAEYMVCPYGCRPDRYLTDQEARALFRKVAEINDRFEKETTE